MADHYVSLTRGTQGLKASDLVTGTSSAATALFEFRVLDGVTPKQTEVLNALDAFKNFFADRQRVVASGFDVAG